MRTNVARPYSTQKQPTNKTSGLPDLSIMRSDRPIQARPLPGHDRVFVVDRPAVAFHLTPRVSKAIRTTVGARPAESGGLLGGSRLTGAVTEFWFDSQAPTTAASYESDPGRDGPVLRAWNSGGVSWLGLCHSHPRSLVQPSSADLEMCARNLDRNKGMRNRFLAPIIQTEPSGGYALHGWEVAIDRRRPVPRPIDFAVVDTASHVSAADPDMFARIAKAVDLDLMTSTRVVLVGCGGASTLAEYLARQGVGEIVLIDPDVVSIPNLATQTSGRSTADLGRPKVLVTAERITALGSHTRVVAVHAALDDLHDEEVGWLLNQPLDGPAPRVSLLVGATDSFMANARVARLGLHHCVGTLVAGAYPGGVGFQLAHALPGVTRACIRCALGQAYRVQFARDGGPRDGVSEGANIWVGGMLDGTAGMVLTAMAHRADPRPSDQEGAARWRETYDLLGCRNLVHAQVLPDPHFTHHMPDFRLFARSIQGADRPDALICGAPLHLPQDPEHPDFGFERCIDCGGTGDLQRLEGTFTDCRLDLVPARGGQ